jgi:transcriptional regulator with XRE-family HTH domain
MEENRLKIIRDDLGGISQARLAEFIGVSINKVRDAESGKTKISTEVATALEERFRYNFKWVLTGEGEPKGESPKRPPHEFIEEAAPKTWVQSASSILNSETVNLSPHQRRVIELLLRYGNEALFADLEVRLLRIKQVMDNFEEPKP